MKELHQDGAPIRIFAGGSTVADVPFDVIPGNDVIKDPSIIVKSRGYIGFEYYEKPFSHKNEFWSYTIQDKNINQKFIYYYLLTQINKFQKRARAVSVKIPQLSVADTDDFKIHLLPSNKNRENSGYLTELEAELEAGWKARKKQYDISG